MNYNDMKDLDGLWTRYKDIKHKYIPYKYQQAAIETAYNRLEKVGFFALFMEMGTGKTKSSLNVSEILYKYHKINNILIIAPKALLSTWLEQIPEHTYYDVTPFVWDASKVNTKKYQKLIEYEKNKKELSIQIINIESFQRPNNALKSLLDGARNKRTLCILDESSKIKTHTAARTKNLIKCAKDFTYKMILTGTEITNSVLDLYTQFEFLRPGFWGLRSFYTFRAIYAIMVDQRLIDGRTFKKVVGYRNITKLITKINQYCFRVKKKDALDLPEKIYTTIKVDMTKDQKNIYDSLKNELFAEYKDQLLTVPNKIALFTRFRQITGGFMPGTNEQIGEKNQKLLTILEDCEDYDGKIIIWSAFRAELEYIVRYINKETNKKAVAYHGGLSNEQRESALTEFKNNEDVTFFVGNPASAAFGLNLQYSSLTYWYSRTLSPEQNWQAEDRQHRIGQKNNVVYKDVVCRGTIDERILKLLTRKTDMKESFQAMTIQDVFKLV